MEILNANPVLIPGKSISSNEHLKEGAEMRKEKIGEQRGREGNWEDGIVFSCVMSGGCARMHIHRINGDILGKLVLSGHLSTFCAVSEIIKILNLIHCLEIALEI